MSPLEELNEACGEVLRCWHCMGVTTTSFLGVFGDIGRPYLCIIVILPVVELFAAFAMSRAIRFVEVAGWHSHRKETHVISSNTVITSCEKGRKWFLSSVLWIDAKFVGVMEPLRVRLFTAVVHPLYCGIFTELNNWVFGRVLCLRRLVDAGAKEAYQYSRRLGLWVSVRRSIAGELWENWR